MPIAERHRRDRQRQHAVAHHRIDQQHLEGEAQQEHREQDAEDDREPERRAGMHRRQHQERRQHHELALREIDGLRGLPQQREADRDQRIDRAGGKSRDQKIEQIGHFPLSCPCRRSVVSLAPFLRGEGGVRGCLRELISHRLQKHPSPQPSPREERGEGEERPLPHPPSLKLRRDGRGERRRSLTSPSAAPASPPACLRPPRPESSAGRCRRSR